MRYSLFQRTRQRHKKAMTAKNSEMQDSTRQKRQSQPVQKPYNGHMSEQETARDYQDTPYASKMRRDPVDQQEETSRDSHFLPISKQPGLEPREVKASPEERASEERTSNSRKPKTLAEAIKKQSKPNTNNYLPIAMPRPDPPEDEDAELEYRTTFDAPEHIEVHSTASYGDDDERTEVSALTHHEFASGHNTRGSSYAQHRMGDQLSSGHERNAFGTRRISSNSPGKLEIVTEEKSPNYELFDEETEESERYIDVDVTDLDNIHDAMDKVKKDLKKPINVEDRYGLPYEETDFKADEASEDSWSQAIVGSHMLEAKSRTRPKKRDPGEGGESNRHIMGPPTPRTRTNDQNSQLIKETMSAEGEVIIDLSDHQYENIGSIERLKTSAKTGAAAKTKTLPKTKTSPRPEKTRTSPRAKTKTKAAAKTKTSPRAKKGTENDRPDDKNPTQPQPDPWAVYSADKAAKETSKFNAEVRDDNATYGKDFFAHSFNYLQSFADGLHSHFQNIELVSDKDMDGMLGVLGKDLKETSKKVPEEKDEIVIFLGEQLEKTACGIDRSAGEHGQELKFPAEELDELVKSVTKTYKKNLVDCGAHTSEYHKKMSIKSQRPVPQTFIVPITLYTQAYEAAYEVDTVNNSVVESDRE
jgi:hypothetical protein